MKIKVHTHYYRVKGKEKLDCICLKENKGCEYPCEVEIVDYDEFQGVDECFLNKGKKDYE